ncbi:hypothetical protein FMM05_18380 [Flavobacterium zepuense]|uniref:Chain length determinant protein n=1 Tax=Flavobacterium zepuense TaxID=2593302 RepID=A0A552UVA4_9FLAO|nr:hypothetical protein [Flavobacterium zepuense]TRW22156.1 hypothetical protein FMM05_18380 [Flavobacterium zepuense]
MDNQTNTSNEVDLHYVGQKVKGFATKANDYFFDFIMFFKRHIIIIVIIAVAGFAYGFYKDSLDEAYEHKVLVIPNFKSVEYLYKQAEKLNNKIGEEDLDYFAKLGVKYPGKLAKIEVQPVVDIYDFVDDVETYEMNDKKFDLFKLISESGDINAILKEHSTSKNYKYHTIIIRTGGKTTEEDVVAPILKYLNSNEYFNKIQKAYQQNLDYKLSQNDTLIKQMDNLLIDFSTIMRSTNNNLTYYHNETDLGDIINIKERTIGKRDKYLVDKENFTSTIKEMATLMNVRYKSKLTGLMMFVYPIVFVGLFCAIMFVIAYYKRQVRNRKALTQNI